MNSNFLFLKCLFYFLISIRNFNLKITKVCVVRNENSSDGVSKEEMPERSNIASGWIRFKYAHDAVRILFH